MIEILDGKLFLSGTPSVEEVMNGFTHILNVSTRTRVPPHGIINYLQFHVNDSPQTDLYQYFEKAFEFIESGVNNPCGKVLVHCEIGKSRSPTVIMAYLVKGLGWSLLRAWEHISALVDICPNLSFIEQLRLWECNCTGAHATLTLLRVKGDSEKYWKDQVKRFYNTEANTT